jgi:uncharacterized Fe-S center protein
MSSLLIEFDECKSCGVCIEICKGGAFDSEGNYKVKFNSSLCLGCPDCIVPENCLGECIRRV